MTKAVTEKELQEKSVAPRVTKEQIDALMDQVKVHTTTSQYPTPHVMAIAWLDGKFHLGTAISKADITTGYFNEHLGVERSTNDVLKLAENKLWELEGYRLFQNGKSGFLMLTEVNNPIKFKKGDYGVFPKSGLSLNNDQLFIVVKGNYRSAGNTMIDIRFVDLPEKCINKIYVAGVVKANDLEIEAGKRL